MKLEVNENRNINQSGIAGTMNENNVTELEIVVPEKYKDFTKTITFITEDGVHDKLIKNDRLLLTKAVTKYRRVGYYITLTKGDKIFNSVPKELEFNNNIPSDGEIPEEDLGLVHQVVNILEEEITKVTDLEKEVQALVDNIQFKLDNGEFIGPEGPQGKPGSIKFIVVNELPTENIDESAIYMKSSNNPEEQNTYEEFIYVNETWESLGIAQVEVDLTEYIKNTDKATSTQAGIVSFYSNYGVTYDTVNNNSVPKILKATEAEINAKANNYKAIVPSNLDYAVGTVKASESQSGTAKMWISENEDGEIGLNISTEV